MAFEEGTTYYVSSEEDDTVLLAIDAKITDNGVDWFDTVRDRAFPIESIQTEGRVITVRTADATYRFDWTFKRDAGDEKLPVLRRCGVITAEEASIEFKVPAELPDRATG